MELRRDVRFLSFSLKECEVLEGVAGYTGCVKGHLVLLLPQSWVKRAEGTQPPVVMIRQNVQ